LLLLFRSVHVVAAVAPLGLVIVVVISVAVHMVPVTARLPLSTTSLQEVTSVSVMQAEHFEDLGHPALPLCRAETCLLAVNSLHLCARPGRACCAILFVCLMGIMTHSWNPTLRPAMNL
jgi:hypothetical protein